MPDSGWSSDLASGLRELDAANESLFFLIGHLFTPGVECKRQRGVCPRTGCGKVAALTRFLSRNLAAQERMMTEAGYPAAAEHCHAHAELLTLLRALSDKGSCGDIDEDLIRGTVTAWAREHLRSQDKPLGEWLQRRGITDS